MKKISFWAKNNPKQSRHLILTAYILNIANALFLGTLLFMFDWGASKWLLIAFCNIFGIAFILYPKKNSMHNLIKHSYFRQKALDFTLVFSSALVIALGFNNFLVQNDIAVNQARQGVKAKFVVNKLKSKKDRTNQRKVKRSLKQKIKASKKKIRRELRSMKRAFKKNKSNSLSRFKQILLTFLSIFVAFELAAGVAVLACGISCSGGGNIVYVVLFGGWALVGVLLGFVLFKIWKK